MRIRNLPLALLLASFCACTTTEYLGETYAPTENVDVVFSMDDLERPHTVMGELKGEATEYLSFEKIEQDMVKDAMAKGADAIVFYDMSDVEVGSTTVTTGTTDAGYYVDKDGELQQKGDGHQYSTTTLTKDHVVKAKLIKYTD